MGIKFNDFKIKGIDVSGYNDLVDWDKVKANGVDFCGIRAGYGNTVDYRFRYNWEASKGKVHRFAYWYLDYYSNWYNPQSPFYGLSDELWGKQQANNCWNLLKKENDGIITFLDIESGGASYSPPIYSATAHVQGIAKAFLLELDKLSGLINGIYCSYGILSWFASWFKNRPLWVAWYTDYQTSTSVLSNVAKQGWTGKCGIWQYASDGDIDDDGVGDGKKVGSSYNFLDLNGWILSESEYENFVKGATPEPEEPEEPEKPLFQVRVIISSLNIRNCPSTSCPSIGKAIYNKIYNVYATSGDWMRIGEGQWFYGIPQYVTKLGEAPPSGNITRWKVTATLGLRIRSKPNIFSERIGIMKYNEEFSVSEIDANNWGKLYEKDGYVLLDYAKKI